MNGERAGFCQERVWGKRNWRELLGGIHWRNPIILLEAMSIGAAATVVNGMDVPQKTKNGVDILSCICMPGHISQQNYNLKTT